MKFKYLDYPADGIVLDKERNPVNARVIRHLIYAGAFDNCNKVGSVCERYGLLKQAANILGFEISPKEVPEGMEDKHYFWSQQQITLAGFGCVDYLRIWNCLEKPQSANNVPFLEFSRLDNRCLEVTRAAMVGTILEVTDKTYKSRQDNSTKHFGKIKLQQNNDIAELTIWDNSWAENKHLFVGKEGTIIAAVVAVKWSDYSEKNQFQLNRNSFIIDIK